MPVPLKLPHFRPSAFAFLNAALTYAAVPSVLVYISDAVPIPALTWFARSLSDLPIAAQFEGTLPRLAGAMHPSNAVTQLLFMAEMLLANEACGRLAAAGRQAR